MGRSSSPTRNQATSASPPAADRAPQRGSAARSECARHVCGSRPVDLCSADLAGATPGRSLADHHTSGGSPTKAQKGGSGPYAVTARRVSPADRPSAPASSGSDRAEVDRCQGSSPSPRGARGVPRGGLGEDPSPPASAGQSHRQTMLSAENVGNFPFERA